MLKLDPFQPEHQPDSHPRSAPFLSGRVLDFQRLIVNHGLLLALGSPEGRCLRLALRQRCPALGSISEEAGVHTVIMRLIRSGAFRECVHSNRR